MFSEEWSREDNYWFSASSVGEDGGRFSKFKDAVKAAKAYKKKASKGLRVRVVKVELTETYYKI